MLFDPPGPIARRRIFVCSIVAALVIAAGLAWVIVSLSGKGQFDGSKWRPLIEEHELIPFLAGGLGFTVLATALALVLSLVLGVVLAVSSLSRYRWLRVASITVVECFRGLPVLLLMLFFFLAFPVLFGVDLPALWTVVVALTLSHGAVICEIVRAGIAALPSGQAEAAYSIGMSRMQGLRFVVLPQALRIMLPVLVSDLVILLKDTSLGFIIAYDELATRGEAVALMFNNPLQTFGMIAVIYIILNSVISGMGNYLSNRQRMPKTPPPQVIGVE